MINSYVEYIDRYLALQGLAGLKEPGEHHFVSVYLVPKLYSIAKIVPDYVNPDGTKSILGDVVYYRDGKHAIGIEVKLGTIRLTAKEFNNWILNPNISEQPNILFQLSVLNASARRSFVPKSYLFRWDFCLS